MTMVNLMLDVVYYKIFKRKLSLGFSKYHDYFPTQDVTKKTQLIVFTTEMHLRPLGCNMNKGDFLCLNMRLVQVSLSRSEHFKIRHL